MAQPLTTFAEVGTKRTGSRHGGKPQKYVLDEPGRRLLLARYDGKSATITELVNHFQVPRWVVRRWAQQLGLARQKEPPWSLQDIAYLEKWLHRKSLAHIAAHLGRTKTAVKLKAKRLGMCKTSEGYTLTALCLGLGCDHHKVQRWVALGWLKGSRRETERTQQQGGNMWCFSDAAIRRLIVEHPTEIDPRRIDWVWVVSLLS